VTVRAALIGLLLAALPALAAAAPAFDADGYRRPPYRAPTPASLDGATVLDTDALVALRRRRPDTVLIDVYNATWTAGDFLLERPHPSLPGAVWLPNTGTTPLAPRWRAYLLDHLRAFTEHDRQRPLVFFCRSDCWLSWNAARRALAAGHPAVYWYPLGVDGWRAAGRPVSGTTPAPAGR